jgi:hypothetical protein
MAVLCLLQTAKCSYVPGIMGYCHGWQRKNSHLPIQGLCLPQDRLNQIVEVAMVAYMYSEGVMRSAARLIITGCGEGIESHQFSWIAAAISFLRISG